MKRKKLSSMLAVVGLTMVVLAALGTWLSASGAGAVRSAVGSLRFVEMHQEGVDSVTGLGWTRSVAVSPDGQNVYAVAALSSTIVVFDRNTVTGGLTYLEMHQDDCQGGSYDGLCQPWSVSVSPDGKNVYVASQADDTVTVFSRSAVTGGLTYLEMHQDDSHGGTVDGLDGASSVTVSPDGKHVYATGRTDDAVAVFSRSAITGGLTFVEMYQDDNQGGSVDGLDVAMAVVVSPDGKNVYVGSLADYAVVVFSRNAITGGLTFVEMQQDDVHGGSVDGLWEVPSVAVSPDGNHVYAAGNQDAAVVVFSRSSITGGLTYVETQDYNDGVDDLKNSYCVAVRPDGDGVYAVGHGDDAIVVFERNETTGALTYVETLQDGVGGLDGLGGVISIVISPDGHHVYAAAKDDHAVTVFARWFLVYLPLVIKNSP